MSYKTKPKPTCTQRALFERQVRRFQKFINAIPLKELETVVRVGKTIKAGGSVLPNEARVYEEHIKQSAKFSAEVIAEHNRRKAKESERTA